MKIIQVDNYGRETISDILIAENVNLMNGKEITEFLNKKYSGVDSSIYFRLVKDDYKLFVYNI